MSTAPKHRYTVDEYLAFEESSSTKHEYYQGGIFAMVGASPEHVLIATNLVRELSTRLKPSPCTVYSTDLKVRINATGLYTYPDVAVVCGAADFVGPNRNVLTNPKLLIEILSPSTEGYDRTTKFGHYQSIESLKDYVLVAQDVPRVEHYTRQPDGTWSLSETTGLEAAVSLASIGCELPMREIYDKLPINR